MEEKLAELYNKLASQIIDMIPVEWDDINYLGEVKKGKISSSSVFYFKDTKKNIRLQSHKILEIYKVSRNVYVNLWKELNHILLEIYDCFIENGQEPWEQLSLSFNAEGNFKIEFFYDVMKEEEEEQIDKQVDREVIWAYQTFSYVPEEGSYHRKILDEYLKKQVDK